jgi:hypothetical protein
MWMFLLYLLTFVVTFVLIIRFIGGTEEPDSEGSKEGVTSKLKSLVPDGGLSTIIWWILILLVAVTLFYFWDPVKSWVIQSDMERWSEDFSNLPILTVVQNNYGWIGLFLVIVGISWEKMKWMKSVGGLLILFAIFFSGYADWTKSKIEQGSTVLSCNVDPTQPKCVLLENQQAKERAQENQKWLNQIRRQAQIKAAKQAAQEAARPTIKEAPPGEPCGGAFADLKGCESIVFGKNEKRDHVPPIAFCSVGDGPISMESIGGGEYRWTPNAENVRGRVFSLKVGESFGGFTCGG